jgi:hypothetical protein
MRTIGLGGALLMMFSFLPQTLLAQYGSNDAGQYVIQGAQYGTPRHHIDVTNRLKELARQDRVFIMGNRTFGVDPDPGQRKILRIYASDPNGQQRIFDFNEGQPINGAMFRGWSTGQWGNGGWNGGWEGSRGGNAGYDNNGYHNDSNRGDAGQFTILSAQYGTSRNHVDVTNRLKELARRDMSFRMGNSTFGVDPDHGRIKTLRIIARGPDGRVRAFDYREGSVVDGSQFRSWQRGDWGHERWNGRWDADDNR